MCDCFVLQDPCEVLNMLAAPKCGTTPLHDAVGNNHLQVAELLLTAGGNLNQSFPCYKPNRSFAVR